MTRREKIHAVACMALYLDNYYTYEKQGDTKTAQDNYQRFVGVQILLCDLYKNAEDVIAEMTWNIGIAGMLEPYQVAEYADRLEKE